MTVRLRPLSTAVLAVGGASWLTAVVGWHSPVRVVLALAFLLFGPGLVLGELLGVRDLALRLTVAFGGSFAVGTLVALPLVYAHAFSTALALGLILVLTLGCALAAERWGQE